MLRNYTSSFPKDKINNTIKKELLQLIDRIDYIYLQTNGAYGDLHPCVSDQVKYVKKLLDKAVEDDNE